MPVFIENLTADVDVTAADLPLTSAQLEQLAALVARRLADGASQPSLLDATTALHVEADPLQPPFRSGGRP